MKVVMAGAGFKRRGGRVAPLMAFKSTGGVSAGTR